MWPPGITEIIQCLKEFTIEVPETKILTNAIDVDQQGNIQTLDNTYVFYEKCWVCFQILDKQQDIYTPTTMLYLRYCKLLLKNPFLNSITDFHKVHNAILYGDGWPAVEKRDVALVYKGVNSAHIDTRNTQIDAKVQKKTRKSTEEVDTNIKITNKVKKKKYRFRFRDTCLSTWQTNIRNSLMKLLHAYISPNKPSYKLMGWMFIETLYNDSYFALRQSPVYPINTTVRQYCENIVQKFEDQEMIIQICENKSRAIFNNGNIIKEYDDFIIYNHGNSTNTVHFKYNIHRPYTLNALPFVGCLFLFLIKQDTTTTHLQISSKILELLLQDDLFVQLSYCKDGKEHYNQFIKGLASATKQNTNGKPFNIFQDIIHFKRNTYYDGETGTYELKPTLTFKNNKGIYVIKDDTTNDILYRYTNLVDPPLTKDFLINDQFCEIITLSNVEGCPDVGRWVHDSVINACALEANITYAKALLYLCKKNIDIPIDKLSKVFEEEKNSFLSNNYVNINSVSIIIDQIYYKHVIEKNPHQLIEINNMKFIFISSQFEYISQDITDITIGQDMLKKLNSDLYLKIISGDTSNFTLKTILDFDFVYFQAVSKATITAPYNKLANDMLKLIYYIKMNYDTSPLVKYLVNKLNKTTLLYKSNTSISLYQHLYNLLHEHCMEKNNVDNILSTGTYIYFQYDSELLLYTFTQSDYIKEAIEPETLLKNHEYIDFIELILQTNPLHNIDKEIVQKRICDWITSFSRKQHQSFMNQLLQKVEYYLLHIWNVYLSGYKSIILLNMKAEEAIINTIIHKVIKKPIATKTLQPQNQLNWVEELTQYFPKKLCVENAIHLSSKSNELMCILHNVLYSYNSLEDYLIGEWIKTQLLGFSFLKEQKGVVLIVIHSNIVTDIYGDFNIYNKLINSNYDISNIKKHPFLRVLHEILFNRNVDNIGSFTWFLTKIWNTDRKYTNFKITLNVPLTPNNLENFKDYMTLDKSNNDMLYVCNIHESLFRDLFHY